MTAPVTAPTHNEKNAFFEACTDGQLETVDALLEKHPALVNARSDDGWTPLFLAVQWARTETVAYLLAHGADMDARDQAGRTALNQADQLNFSSISDLFRDAAARREHQAEQSARAHAIGQFSSGLDAPLTLPRKTLRLAK